MCQVWPGGGTETCALVFDSYLHTLDGLNTDFSKQLTSESLDLHAFDDQQWIWLKH